MNQFKCYQNKLLRTNNSSKYTLVIPSLEKKQCWEVEKAGWKTKPESFWFINTVFQHQLFCLCSPHCYTCLLAYAPSGWGDASASSCCRLSTCSWALRAHSEPGANNPNSDPRDVPDYRTYTAPLTAPLKFCGNAEMKCILMQENSWLQQKIKLPCWPCWKQQQGHLPALPELWQNHSHTKPSQTLLPITVTYSHGKVFNTNIQIMCWNSYQSSPSTRMSMIAIITCHSLREIFLYFLVIIFITDRYLFQGQLSLSGV